MSQTTSLKIGNDEKKGSVFQSEMMMKGFASEPLSTILKKPKIIKHSTLCESAYHKDCTCSCNGKFHGIHSIQSKLEIFA